MSEDRRGLVTGLVGFLALVVGGKVVGFPESLLVALLAGVLAWVITAPKKDKTET